MFTLVDFSGFAKAAEGDDILPTVTVTHEDDNFPGVPGGFESFKVDPPVTGTHTYVNGSITLKFYGGDKGISQVDFSSNKPIYYVFVKGGEGGGGNLYKFEPFAKAWEGLFANIKNDGYQDISHVTVYYKNEFPEKKANLTVEKRLDSETGALAPGITFKLYKLDSNGAKVGNPLTGTTGENGQYTFSNLPLGDYEIEEVNAPVGYVKSGNITVTLPENGLTKRVVNLPEEKKASLTVEKRLDSETGALAPGITFKLYKLDSNGAKVGEPLTGTTGENGQYTFSNLPLGDYEIEEVNAPVGYVKSGNITVTLPENGLTKRVVNLPEEKKANLTVEKRLDSATGPLVPGITFKLYKLDIHGTKVGEPLTGTTGENGQYTFSNLPLGDYEIEEVNAPLGYVKSDNIKVTLPESGLTQTVVNLKEEKKANLTVEKRLDSLEGAVKSGVTFKLYKLDSQGHKVGNPLVGVTGENGQYTFTNLSLGDYEIEEVNAPIGYVKSSNIKVTLPESGLTQKVVNLRESDPVGNIMIFKKVKIGDKAPAAPDKVKFTFNLLKDGKVFRTGETNANGILEFDNLPVGEYVLEEAPSDDYTTSLNSSNNKITVKKNETTTVEVVNTLKQTDEDSDEDEDLPNTGGFAEMELLLAAAGALIILLGIRLRRVRR